MLASSCRPAPRMMPAACNHEALWSSRSSHTAGSILKIARSPCTDYGSCMRSYSLQVVQEHSISGLPTSTDGVQSIADFREENDRQDQLHNIDDFRIVREEKRPVVANPKPAPHSLTC